MVDVRARSLNGARLVLFTGIAWLVGCGDNTVTEPDRIWATYFSRPVANSMLPPIQYGVLPTGASQLPDNPEPLKARTQYFINLFVADTMTSELMLVGKDTIVP